MHEALFPLFLKLARRRVLVVGAGPVGAGKAASLLKAGADVIMVAPELSPEAAALPVTVVRRAFQASDLDGTWLVVAAAPPEVNQAVLAAADARHVFVNAVDDPAHASAYTGGVVSRGDATVAISTGGLAPAIAGLLREALDELLPADLDDWVKEAVAQRELWKRDGVPMPERRGRLLQRLNEVYGRRALDEAAATLDARLDAVLAETAVSGAPSSRGFVSLVGAGPGDPALWTVRAAERIAGADIVFYDALADGEALVGRTKARCFSVGKRAGGRGVCQDTIHDLLIRSAKRGRRVVRLKAGDPFVFGRGAEEVLALAEAGVPFEVVPGVSTSIAAAGLAGIPVTHRGVATAFLVVSGHHMKAFEGALAGVKPERLTVIVMMGLGRRAAIVDALVGRGWSPSTPAAVVSGAATAGETVWTGALEELPHAAVDGRPGVIVVGEVVGVRWLVARLAAGEQTGMGEVRHGRYC
jgi:uroporphyrin-III C-methyltransferase/precorrin-2 dehydrogenase/sirohydrochlorin ferrochelatase